jgi:SAM-dependent methyltransferase
VLHQNFFALSLGERQFDGVFANASLFHVPLVLLPSVLRELRRVLVPNGVLFCSNPRAFRDYEEGWHGERYGCYLTIEGWTEVIAAAGFSLEKQYLRPSGKPAEQQPWLAMVCRKPQL